MHRGVLLREPLDHSMVAAFRPRLLAVDDRMTRRAAALHVPAPVPSRDALIGATALVHNMTVVSRDPDALQRFNELDVLNPWN